jgi:hypothetical protein
MLKTAVNCSEMSTESNGQILVNSQFEIGEQYKSRVAAAVCHSTRLKSRRTDLFEEARI